MAFTKRNLEMQSLLAQATTIPWHEFVCRFVAIVTATKTGRELSGGLCVRQVKGGWEYGFIGGKSGREFQSCTAPMTANNMYGHFARSPLSYWQRQADDARAVAFEMAAQR
jgi:hypothetical protein